MIRDILEKQIKKICPEADRGIWWNGNIRGDYSTNVADLKLSEKIKKELSDSEYISKIDVRGGFVNFWLSEKALENGLKTALQEKFSFPSTKLPQQGSGQVGTSGKKVQVEFISANPTGPLTLGNGRGGVCGDVLTNILKFSGHDVTKEYYVNDTGNQIEILGHSILKDGKAEYKGEYIDDLSLRLSSGQASEKDPLAVGKKGAEIILENIKKTTDKMGISYDVWFSEKKGLREKKKVEEIIKWFKEKNLAYEKDGALWFKATDFGDTEDRVLIKKNGEPTYFCVDAAYHKNKFEERKFDKVINIWGADHHGDVARMKGFVEALGYKDKFEIILMQFVRMVKDGKPVSMSKREGNFILIDDILKEINKDAFRYFMLTRSPDTHMDFDLDLAKEQSKKNPVYYVQYAGARMQSILAKSEILSTKSLPADATHQALQAGETISNIKILNSKHERALILKLIQFPEIIEDIVKDCQVHHLTTYIYSLAKTFTDFYENVRVLDATEELKQARLNLVAMTRKILNKGLDLMGIEAPEKM